MCGIFGFSGTLGDGLLERMAASLRHRGPDGEGFLREGPIGLGMTRLAILDPEFGAQPFVSPDRRIHAICNGEIYNWRELRTELEAHGHTFRTQCDCEVLPAAWLQWGDGMLSRLNGMFALAIYDDREKRLVLARDRFGQKPLYYTQEAGEFRFASEIRALLATGVAARADPACLADYLMLRYVPEPRTLFSGIRILPAGHLLELREGRDPLLARWWQLPEPAPFAGTPAEAVEQLDGLTRDAVGLALQSDVPVATYLSSGVDSSLLAHYIREAGARPRAISLGFAGQADETVHAARQARELGLPFERLECGPADLLDLPRVVRQMELPVGDALIVAFDQLAAAAAQSCKVALGGEGADELFGGYSFHRLLRTSDRLGRAGRAGAAAALRLLPAPLLDRLSPFPAEMGPSGRAKIVRYLRRFGQSSPWWRGVALRTLFEPAELANLLHPDLHHTIREPAFDPGPSLLDAHLREQFSSWMQDWSLIRQERNGMAHSLEFRAPFLDHRLAEFAFSLPLKWKLRGGGKWIWRQLAARHLPRPVARRPKIPFYFPLESFSNNRPFRELVQDTLTSSAATTRGFLQPETVSKLIRSSFQDGEFLPLKQVTSLLILELWFREFIDP